MNDENSHTRFWQGLAGIAFSLWAVLVPLSARWVVESLSEMADAQRVFAQESARRNELLEGRITRLEERQQFVMQTLRELQSDHNNHKPH